jgi:galactose-1-phosphate uridylyltransferase
MLKMNDMLPKGKIPLQFTKETLLARFVEPGGDTVERPIEVRTNPITGRTCRITFSRIAEKETGTEHLPEPPAEALDTSTCPFCHPQLENQTPRLQPDLAPAERLKRGESVLFPNLFPYGSYSAVSLFDNHHFVQIGSASVDTYTDSFLNAADYLTRILHKDPAAVYQAITQNHLPSAGGSLLHPHLQINADTAASNHHRFLTERSNAHFEATGRLLLQDYLAHELEEGHRMIGRTGPWHWLAAYAPEGFFEIWGVLPGITSFGQLQESDWQNLAQGVCNSQKFYRSLNRNGYNLGLLTIEHGQSKLEMRVILVVRSNYAPWVRNDHTGFEVMLGDMATFNAPEETAAMAQKFWSSV